MTENEFDKLLNHRRFTPASVELSARIIRKAAHVPQRPAFNLSEWVQRTFTEFHLPRPAYSFATMLLIGLAVGGSLPDSATVDDSEDITYQTMLYANEELL